MRDGLKRIAPQYLGSTAARRGSLIQREEAKNTEKAKRHFFCRSIFLISASKENRNQGFKQCDGNKRAQSCLFFAVFARLAAVQFGKQHIGRNLRQTVTGSGVVPEIAFASAFFARALKMVIAAPIAPERGGRQRPSAAWAELIQQVSGGGVFHGLSVFSFCLCVSLSL